MMLLVMMVPAVMMVVSISSCELKARTWHLAGQVFLNSALCHIVSVCASTTYDYNVISTRTLSCNGQCPDLESSIENLPPSRVLEPQPAEPKCSVEQTPAGPNTVETGMQPTVI